MLNQLKILGLSVVTMLALGAVVSSAASAAMELPEFTIETRGASSSGKGELFGAVALQCKKDTDSFSPTSKKSGAFTIDFEECALGGSECHSLGDKAKTTLVGGSWQLVLDTLSGTDSHLVLLELKEVHMECSFLSTLIAIKGDLLGTITPIGTTKKEFSILVKATSRTGQQFKQYENNSGTLVKTQLLSTTDEGAFEESGEEAGTDTLATEKTTEIVK